MARAPQEIAYREAVVTFLDILGFSDLVQNRSAQEISDSVEQVRSFAGARTDGDEDFEIGRPRAVNFSDSVIRIRHFDDDYGIGVLFHEILAMVHAQADLANRGIFVRGGITVGRIHADARNVFGPAFVRAYELESTFANFPRIITDPEVFSILRHDSRLRAHDDVADEIHYIRCIMRRGEDGLWFVDYLKSIRAEMDFPERYSDFLATHRAHVVEGAQNATSSLKILQKYLWLASYHNQICSETDQDHSLRITRYDIPNLETMDDISANIREERT